MDVGGNIVVDIVWAIAALLLLLAAWTLITGRHNRYYRKFRRQGIPPEGRHESRRVTKGGSSG